MIVVDVETSGQTSYLHSILSIGAVDFSNPENQFYKECRMREGAEIDPVSLKINGFSIEDIKSENKPPLESILKEFLGWTAGIKDITLAGQNNYMDLYFFEHSFELYKMKNPFPIRLVDTHTLTYVHYLSRGLEPPLKENGSGISLRVVSEYCGLPEEPKPHNALNGAKMEAEAISRLIYGKNLLIEFKEFTVPDYLKPKRADDNP